ncbi:MAG: hypothetical protein M1822_002675 [Bathelium mastoideum]|nr:MAG: hypothetical protein M1822_002675 [Bathelium mastoideum]
MDPPPPPVRPSGIPRLSRLPVPKSSRAVAAESQNRIAGKPLLPSLRGGEAQPYGSTRLGFTNHRASGNAVKSRAQFAANSNSNNSVRTENNALNQSLIREDVPESSYPTNIIEYSSSIEPNEPGEDDLPQASLATTPKARHPRPSLSDRTMETLSSLPPTPATSRRRSGFFAPSSPPESTSRPTSSLGYKRPGSSLSSRRPSTRDAVPSVPKPGSPSRRTTASARYTKSSTLATPSKRSVSAAEAGSSSNANAAITTSGTPVKINQPNAIKRAQGQTGAKIARNNTIATRSPKPKPALADAFEDKSSPEAQSKTASPKGSAAFREQIAKAKAARRAASLKTEAAPIDGQNGFGLHEDPFNQLPSNNEQVLKKRIDVGRSEGRLNLAAMGLQALPDAVMSMYDFDPDAGVAWSEAVDLTRFIAADNEIEMLPDSVFPDVGLEDITEDEDSNRLLFGGLELLDVHGNRLHSIPCGLRRLGRLSVLNLSHNGLGTSAFEVISQIRSLRELKLSHNSFEGTLPSQIGQLVNLELLELQSNKFAALSDSLQELTHLRVLNVADNQLNEIRLESIARIPLVELSLSNNKLDGALFPSEVSTMSKLQKLDVSNNGLSSLDSGQLSLPSLQTLDISNNRITTLPDVSAWTELLCVLAEDNRLSNLPEGLTELTKVKIVDLTGNGLRHLDPRVGLMDSLSILKLAANPIKERKFLTMDTDDVKQDLRSRIDPLSQAAEGVELPVETHGESNSTEATSKILQLKSGGMLDLSSRSLSSLEDTFQSLDSGEDVRKLNLRHNAFSSMPSQLSLLTTLRNLDLSNNNITDPLNAPLFLPQLQDLNLSFNKIPSTDALTTYFVAPNLLQLNVSSNHLTGSLVPLRTSFPSLTHFLASDNQIENVTAESLRGLTAINLSNNDIGALDPRIGLLWDEGLKSLEVGGNKFRVPGWRVLEKGTETVLAWLRDRIPEDAV